MQSTRDVLLAWIVIKIHSTKGSQHAAPHPDLWSFFIHMVHFTLFYSITSYNGSEDYNLCPPNQEFLIESFVKRKKCLKKGKKMTVSAVKGRLTGSGITCPIENLNGNGDNVAKQKI